MLVKNGYKKIPTSVEIGIFHKYAYIYTKDLFGDNRYIVPLNNLLLRTAFACMSCDGDIAPEEIELIKQMANKDHLFGNIDIEKELDNLIKEINSKGKGFLKQYLICLSDQTLSEDEELKVADVAVQTIRSDNKIEYSEIKFFKVLRANLKVVSDEALLEKIDGIDENYLAQDIKSDYLRLYDDYFNMIRLPKFDPIGADTNEIIN